MTEVLLFSRTPKQLLRSAGATEPTLFSGRRISLLGKRDLVEHMTGSLPPPLLVLPVADPACWSGEGTWIFSAPRRGRKSLE